MQLKYFYDVACVAPYLVTDDFGNELFVPSNNVAWYFLGVERALVK